MFETTLATKVAMLLAGCMACGGLGAYFGRNIRTLGQFIVLAVLFIFGTIGVIVGAHINPVLGVALLAGWTFVSGLVIGPCVQMYAERLGWETVAGAYVGTGGTMAVCGAIGAFSGVDFSGLGSYLFFGLLGLVAVGFVSIFWRLSRTGSIVESIVGMVIFSGYFIYDFFNMTKASNTWESAVNVSMQLYLDFMNFFLYLLQLLDMLKDKH